MRWVLVAAMMAGCGGAASGGSLVLDLTMPDPVHIELPSPGNSGFANPNAAQFWVFFANNPHGDGDDQAPIRLTFTVPRDDVSINNYDEGNIFFRDEDLAIDCRLWSGQIDWLSPEPDWRIFIDATCQNDPAVRLTGVASGKL